jgi:plasmid stabilization system protein ParE
MRIIWSPLAVDRASEIADYIARDKPAAAAAEKWVDTVFLKVEQLGYTGTPMILCVSIFLNGTAKRTFIDI